MRLIIEFDGPVFDIAPVYHNVHRDVAAELGWPHLAQDAYWRMTRKHGRSANVLPGAKPVKIEAYHARFAERVETEDDVVLSCRPHAQIEATLTTLESYGACRLITTGSNLTARKRVLQECGLLRQFPDVVGLNPDPRRRAGELRVLAEGDPRTLVAATGDSIIRAAGDAELLAVGISCGSCNEARLYQAGAAITYRSLCRLAEALSSGAPDLIRAGLLPAPLE